MVDAVDVGDGGRVGVAAAVVERDRAALRPGVQVPAVDKAAVVGEADEGRVSRRAAVVIRPVQADVLNVEGVLVEVRQPAAAAAVLAARVQVALLHVMVAQVIVAPLLLPTPMSPLTSLW